MVTEDDARSTLEFEDCFVILPLFGWQELAHWTNRGSRCPEGFRYGSDTNDRWLTEEELVQMVAGLDTPEAREFARERGISV
jgi:UDP-N-acetylglucosamine 4,6-dehydratase